MESTINNLINGARTLLNNFKIMWKKKKECFLFEIKFNLTDGK